MNQEVEDAGRYMTVILDPHIKHDSSYFVYEEGEEEQEEEYKEDGSMVNIFVKKNRIKLESKEISSKTDQFV